MIQLTNDLKVAFKNAKFTLIITEDNIHYKSSGLTNLEIIGELSIFLSGLMKDITKVPNTDIEEINDN